MIALLMMMMMRLCTWCYLCGTAHSKSLVPVIAMVDLSKVSITASTGDHTHLCILSYDELKHVQQVCEGIDNDEPHHHRYNDRMEGYELRISYKDNTDYSYDDFIRAYQQHAEDRQQQDVVRIKLSVPVQIASVMSVSDVVKVLNSDVDR